MTALDAGELDARTELRAYLAGVVAAGVAPKAAESILSFADAMVAAAREPLDVAALRAWLIDQSAQAHEQANILPGDPAHAWDAGAAHMADASLTRISELLEAGA